MAIERSQKREATMGIIAVAVLVFGFFLIFFLADIRRFFTPRETLYVLMPSAAGLQSAAEVWIAGQPVGEVDDIQVRPPGVDSLERVVVRVSVERRHLEHVRKDSEARITSFRMIGDPVLDITPGTPSRPAIEPNDTLRMRTVGTPAVAIAKAMSLRNSLQELVAQSKTISANARERSVQAIDMSERLMGTAREMKSLTDAIDNGAFNVLGDPEFKRTVGSISALMGELRNSFSRAADRARAARSDAEPALRRLTARADTISAQIALLQTAIASGGGGLLVRVQTDSAIFKALHGAQAQMDSLIAETKRNPTRFWF